MAHLDESSAALAEVSFDSRRHDELAEKRRCVPIVHVDGIALRIAVDGIDSAISDAGKVPPPTSSFWFVRKNRRRACKTPDRRISHGMQRVDDDVRVGGDHCIELFACHVRERVDAQGIHFGIDVEHACFATRAAFFATKRADERVVAPFLREQRLAFTQRAAALLTFAGHVEQPFFGRLLSERTIWETRNDAQVRVRASELVARSERFSMHDARVDEEDVEVERFAVCQTAEQRSGALHARQDGAARTEDAVNEAKDVDGFGVREPLVQGIETLDGDAHGRRASTSCEPVGRCASCAMVRIKALAFTWFCA